MYVTDVSSPKKVQTTRDKNGVLITKHDAAVCGRKNASKVMEKVGKYKTLLERI